MIFGGRYVSYWWIFKSDLPLKDFVNKSVSFDWFWRPWPGSRGILNRSTLHCYSDNVCGAFSIDLYPLENIESAIMYFSSLPFVSTRSDRTHILCTSFFIFYWAKAINMQATLGTCCLQRLLAERGEVTAVHGKFNVCCYLAEPECWNLNVS